MVEISCKPSAPNIAGGVGVYYRIRNTGTKTIIRCELYFEGYNEKGDRTFCTIRSFGIPSTHYDIPLPPGKTSKKQFFRNAWYSDQIASVKLAHVRLEFSDDTHRILEGREIPPIAKRHCPFLGLFWKSVSF